MTMKNFIRTAKTVEKRNTSYVTATQGIDDIEPCERFVVEIYSTKQCWHNHEQWIRDTLFGI
jgi:type IV secretory pathway VirB4 component